MAETKVTENIDCAVADGETYTVNVDCGLSIPDKIVASPQCLIVKTTLKQLLFAEQGTDGYSIKFKDESHCLFNTKGECPEPAKPAQPTDNDAAPKIAANLTQWRKSKASICEGEAASDHAKTTGVCVRYGFSCYSSDFGIQSMKMENAPVIIVETAPPIETKTLAIGAGVVLLVLVIAAWFFKKRADEEVAEPHDFQH